MENSNTMNQQVLESFVKRAQDAGLTKEQAVKYANDYLLASAPQKTAKTLDNYVDEVLSATGVEKSAQSVAYVQGILKEAVDKGYDIDSSVKVAAVVVKNNNAFKKAAPVQQKLASATTEQLSQQNLGFYAEGFLKAATDAGFTPGQGYDLLNHVIKSAAPQPAKVEKKADDGMIAQLMQMLQGNPEMAQQLLGGAGGPGAGAGGPPPGPGGMGGGLAGLMGGGAGAPPPPGPGLGGAGGAPGMGGDMFKSLPQ